LKCESSFMLKKISGDVQQNTKKSVSNGAEHQSWVYSLQAWAAKGAGATFDWLFFDNSKVINFDD
jgi:hypothetical protein